MNEGTDLSVNSAETSTNLKMGIEQKSLYNNYLRHYCAMPAKIENRFLTKLINTLQPQQIYASGVNTDADKNYLK